MSDMIQVIVRDNGVDGTEILGTVSKEDLTSVLMFVLGYNKARQGEMSGLLDLVDVKPFNPQAMQ